MGTLSLPFLLASHRREAPVVALLAGDPDPRRASGLPGDLLLLPQGLLPRLLPRPSRLRGRGKRRAALPRRDRVPLRPAERPPLVPVPRGGLPGLSLVRRGPRVLLRRAFSDRRGLPRAPRQHRPALSLPALLPLPEALSRRPDRLLLLRLLRQGALFDLAGSDLLERAPHALCL